MNDHENPGKAVSGPERPQQGAGWFHLLMALLACMQVMVWFGELRSEAIAAGHVSADFIRFVDGGGKTLAVFAAVLTARGAYLVHSGRRLTPK